VKQVLLRVPDDLHARLAARAADAGQSVNALATQILDAHVDDSAAAGRDRLRARARQLGILVELPSSAPVTPERRQAAIDAMRGVGPIIDQLLADGR
jgi:plasmid stability protein